MMRSLQSAHSRLPTPAAASPAQQPARLLHSVAGRFQSALTRVGERSWDRVRQSEEPARRVLMQVSGEARGKRQRRSSAAQRDLALRRLEAILFLAREPLTGRKLSQFANLADATEARTLIRRLNQIYDRGGRAFRVEELAGGFQLLSRPEFATWLRRLGHVPAEVRLSAPALETLAVIAYRQPVPRADIEAIRGVNCGEILRQLMDRDLVRIAGRGDDLGRPYLYGTTKRFLQMFGLLNLNQLPRAAALRPTTTAAANHPATSSTATSPLTTSVTAANPVPSDSRGNPLSQASESRNLLEQ
ncbi:MAG: SMC-Scp complex subunit ScpB [Planctomycetota bacterium]